ncbi:MAG: hypothetical protein AAGF59_07735 [Pseudomonadota bacterium]
MASSKDTGKVVGLVASLAASTLSGPALAADGRSLATLKAEIFDLAERFKGEGDPDFSRQKQLEVLVDKLLAVAPQRAVVERLDTLAGTWKQVWGPYDYRNNKRGIDPRAAVDDIYQVVFPGGYYYNVTYGDPKKAGDTLDVFLLRGEYKPVANTGDFLKVRFTRFPKTRVPASKTDIWSLAADAETGTLARQSSVVPALIVRLFFGGGYLREVYTDETLRITYGGRRLKDRTDEFIYVMRRVD